MGSFCKDVKNFCEKHTLLCVFTFGLAIPVYCVGNLLGRLVTCIKKPTGTSKKVDDVAKPIPTQPKVSNQTLPPVKKETTNIPPKITPLQPTQPVTNMWELMEPQLKAKAKEDFKSLLETLAKQIEQHQQALNGNLRANRETRIEQLVKKYEIEFPEFTPEEIREMTEDEVDMKTQYKQDVTQQASLTNMDAKLSLACKVLNLTNEDRKELLQTFLDKYGSYFTVEEFQKYLTCQEG